MKVRLDSGETIALGTTETGVKIGIKDYSRRVTDAFGVTTVIERGFARQLSVRLAVLSTGVDALHARMADLRASNALWIADDRAAWLSARGFYKDFEVDLAVPPLSYCQLTVEGTVETEAVSNPVGDPAPAGRASTLQLLQPASITDAELVSSTVAENDAPAWGAGTSYALGARVMRTHRIFESLVAANLGNDPAIGTGQWLDVGPTNRWAMFDQALGTSSTAPGSITVRIDAGTIDAVALLDVVGTAVRVEAAGYDRTVVPAGGAATFLDLPLVAGQVTVTILSGGQAAVGTLLVGRRVSLGITEAAPSAGITDFSRKEVDDFGEVTVVQRAFAKRMAAKALIRTDAIDLVANRIAAVRARPSLWIGQAGLNSLTVYGFFKDFSIEVGERLSKLSLSIEGLSTAAAVKPLGAAVSWPDIADPDGTKPEPNATNSANPAAPFGPDGKTVGETLADLANLDEAQADLEKAVSDLKEGGAATDEALQALAQAGVDRDAAQRLLTRGADRLAEAALRATLQVGQQQTMVADAGITTDPATGKARLWALSDTITRVASAEIRLEGQAGAIGLRATYSDMERAIAKAQVPGATVDLTNLYQRVSDAEVDIDAQEGAIELRATTAELDKMGETVTEITERLDSLGDTRGVTTEVRQVRRLSDDAATAALRGLLAGDTTNRANLVAIAEARRELTTRMDDIGAVGASATTQLGVGLANLDARFIETSAVLIEAGRVSAKALDALSVSSGDQAAAISDLSEAAIDAEGGIAGTLTTIRQQARVGDQTAEALLASLIAGDQGDRRATAQFVQYQREVTTELVDGRRSAAADRVAIAARLGSNEAEAARILRVLTEADRALAEDVSSLGVSIGKDISAAVSRLEKAIAEGDEASAKSIESLDADFTKDIGAAVVDLKEVIAKAGEAQAKSVELLRANLDDPETGLAAAHSDIATVKEAVVDDEGVRAIVGTALTAKLGDLGTATVQDLIEAVVETTGKIMATRTILLDVNRNLVGTQLVGSDEGRGSLNLINADLKMGTGRLIFDTGTVMLVAGLGFGAARDLVMWFGPTMALDRCTRANGTFWLGTEAAGYFGGGLTAGTLRNGNASSGISDNETVDLGPFGSNGKPIRYIANWSCRSEINKVYSADPAGLQEYEADRATFGSTDGRFGTRTAQMPASTIVLTRSTNGSLYEEVSRGSFTTETQTWNAIAPVPGDGPGSARITAEIGGGFTVNEPTQAVTNRWLRLKLTRGYPFPSTGTTQRLSIVAIEE